MEDYKDKLKEKTSNSCNVCASSILLICYIILFIFIIIWLFKLNNNTKSEPKSRERYIIEDPSIYYREDEFCYEKYEPFLVKGALDIFDLPMSKISKFCKALLSTLFISLGNLILSIIITAIGRHKDSGSCVGFGCLFYVLHVIAVILSIIFAIILVHYYTKGNYRDFYEFYRCRYLSQKFRKDYSFVFDVETGYQTPMALIIITEFFNFIKLIAEFGPDIDAKDPYK